MERREKDEFIEDIWELIGEAYELDLDDSDKDAMLLALCDLGERVTKLPIKKRKRKWIKEWRKQKDASGSFAFLNKELLLHDEASFRNYVRMSKPQFDILCSLIRADIERADTIMRTAIPVEEKLAMTLRFLATGESYVSLDYQTRLSKSSICGIIPEVCDALYKHLKTSYLKFPSNPLEWEAIAKEFDIKWQFPNCLGALDGKHISFRSLRKDGAYFHNYKGTNSIVLLALVDANYKFIFTDVGCNGRNNDAGVFLQSRLSNILQENENLPQDGMIGNNRSLPYVVIGDDAFPLQKHLMKPYPYHSQSSEKQIYNKRLSRARQTVEHAFGMLSNRFRVFLAPMNVSVLTVQKITLACSALHNFLIDMGEPTDIHFSEEIATTSRAASQAHYNPRNGAAENIRQKFTSYFNEEGKLDWLNPT